MFTRVCRICKKEIYHKNKYNRNQAEHRNTPCRKCSNNSKERKQKRIEVYYSRNGLGSKDLSEKNNPFYGKAHSNEFKKSASKRMKGIRRSPRTEFGQNGIINRKSTYQCWLEKFGKEVADVKLIKLKEKQSINATGSKNSMYGKPAPQGSGNGWSGWYKGWFFRSLLELSFMINEIEKKNLSWKSGECKELKIPYINYDGVERNYFPDFLINNHLIIECKPKALLNSANIKAKNTGAKIFCKKNNLKFKIVAPKKISKEEIKILHDKKLIKFLPRYEEKFRTWSN